MSANERIESMVLVLAGLLGMTVWYNLWVGPQDEIRFAIINCMGDEHSEEAYEVCRDQVLSVR